MVNKKSKVIFIIMAAVFFAILICVACFATVQSSKIDASAGSNLAYSDYSGYSRYREFEVASDTNNPMYVVCYRSKEGTRYVSNGFVSCNNIVYTIEHTQGDSASIEYSTTSGDDLTVGAGISGSVGSEAGGLFNSVSVELSVSLGYSNTTSTEKGSSVEFSIDESAPSGTYGIEECVLATEFIFDFYKASWKTVTETYKEGKSTKTRNVKVRSGYESNKCSSYKYWMAEDNASVFYRLARFE